MAKRRAGVGGQKSVKAKKGTEGWASLTWDDLSQWAGSRSVTRGRRYQRQGAVEDLAVAEGGRLLAWVVGGDRYVTSVWCTSDSPRESPVQSKCTCPVGFDGCKHAVAVVAEYLERLAGGKETPAADEDDERWELLDGSDAESDEDLDDFGEHGYDDDEADARPVRTKRTSKFGSKAKSHGRTDWDRKIAEHIRGRSREELAELVISLTERFSELREEFQERISLGEGDVDRLLAQARKQMRAQTSEMGWRNHWNGEGFTPDYSGFRHRLERLVELRYPDKVVELGGEFIRLGMQQVEQSHDEGETGAAVAECFPVIFTAVAQSRLSGPEQLLFAIDACLEDDWDYVGRAAEPILEGDWTASDWSEVADRLQRRLDSLPTKNSDREDSFSRSYERDCISGWVLHALEKAGRAGELRGLYEAEATKSGSYERLVRYLIEVGDLDAACRWAHEGIAKTCEKLPGIADNLACQLREVARQRKQWDVVAAHAACDFFEHPGQDAFEELLKTARKAKCLEAVKVAALHFLESGELPFQRIPQGQGKHRTFRIEPGAKWPLPLPEYLASQLPSPKSARPHYGVLLEMAIADKRPDDVLHWYEKLNGGRKASGAFNGRGYGSAYGDQVAAAVAKSHPERALEIYMDGLNANLQHADPNAYARAAGHLKKLRPILKQLDRESEWTELVAKLRDEYKRRRLFVEALDRLESRPIVQSRQQRQPTRNR